MQAQNIATQARHAAQDDLQWQWEQHRLGYDRFTAQEPPAECQNAEQWRGWWAALNAASNTDTDIYLRGGRG